MIRPFVLNHNTSLRRDGGAPQTDIDHALRDIGGNSGNTYITYALARHTPLERLDGVANIFANGAIASIDIDDVNSRYTHVFLVLQDHLRLSAGNLPWQELAALIGKFRIPVVVFSLGANSFGESARELAEALPAEMVQAIRTIAGCSLSLGIRGAFTADVLDHLAIKNYEVVGCPAWFEAGANRVVAFPEFDASKPVAATGLFSHAQSHQIQYFLQDEELFLRSMFKGEPPEHGAAASLIGGYPHYGSCAVAAFYAGRMYFHHDMRSWKEELGKGFSFAAGTRVHGAFAAMNAGLPALCTSGDARSKEMCDLFKLPHRPGLCAADLPLEQLYELADPSAANAAYPAAYEKFVSWLQGLGIHCSDGLHAEPAWPIGAVRRRPRLEQDELMVLALTLARGQSGGRATDTKDDEMTRSKRQTDPLLSICIPTYNRAGHLEKLLRFLRANILQNPRYSIEVIAVNNASTDGTREMLDGLQDDRIRIIHRDEHLPTAEENIFRSIQYCTGEFIWFLGDDDVPMLENFDDHYALIEGSSHDFLLFNPAIADSRGTIVVLQNVKMNRLLLELPIAEMVAMIGCFFTLAGISNGIMRRRMMTTERGLHFMAISQIYSMVAWMIDAAKTARCVFVNAPLVYYRENDYSDGHWQRVAARLGVGDQYFWSTGVVKLLRELIVQGALTPADIGRIREVNRDGRRHNLIDDILFKYYLQHKAALSDPSPRQQLSAEEMAAASRFFAEVDPTTFDLVECLKGMAAGRDNCDEQEQRFLKRFGERQAAGVWIGAVQRIYKGYEVIKTPVQLTAVRLGRGGAHRDQVMMAVDPLPCPPDVLVALTWSELSAQLDQQSQVAPPVSEAQATPQPIHVHLPSIGEEQARQAALVSETLGRLTAVYNSNSWRLTSPLRAVRVLASRIARRLLRRA